MSRIPLSATTAALPSFETHCRTYGTKLLLLIPLAVCAEQRMPCGVSSAALQHACVGHACAAADLRRLGAQHLAQQRVVRGEQLVVLAQLPAELDERVERVLHARLAAAVGADAQRRHLERRAGEQVELELRARRLLAEGGGAREGARRAVVVHRVLFDGAHVERRALLEPHR
eukprot:CAMPEP_0195654342 /NCGR_PEP_ID=MMETSP0815-20121206/33866_1 /TAXON_ID=97485 /ORGANISM="Prymnesium parvum, Strain Texoma1" /LENGTH=172 /DNA_ID=CAMNT_0040798541 /DNA_START=82 /DNA_END=595 /DNA_ORIENTATION=-